MKMTKPKEVFGSQSKDKPRKAKTRVFGALICLSLTCLSSSLVAQTTPSFVLDGVVTLHGQTEVGAVAVRLHQDTLAKETYTDPEGNYIFRNVAQGTYRLSATYPGYTTHEEEITITGPQRKDLTLFLEETLAISIGVSFSGAPSDRVDVQLRSELLTIPDDGSWAELKVVGDTATWDVEAPQSEWVLDVQAPGYEDVSVPIGALENATRGVLTVRLIERSPYEVNMESGCQSTRAAPSLPSVPVIVLAACGWVLTRRPRRRNRGY